MPSPRDPSTLSIGPGRVPASTVPAGALIPPPGGGGGGPVLAKDVNYSGDGPWVDGEPNPGTTVEAQLTKIITDLTHDSGGSFADPHSGADRISARTTATKFADSTTVTGISAQALTEAVITALASTTAHHGGSDKVGAHVTTATFADGSTAISANTVQGLTEATVTDLGRFLAANGTNASVTVTEEGAFPGDFGPTQGSPSVLTTRDCTSLIGNAVVFATQSTVAYRVESAVWTGSSPGTIGLATAYTGPTPGSPGITTAYSAIVTVGGLSGITPLLTGQLITLRGSSTTPTNGGSVAIASVLSSTSVQVVPVIGMSTEDGPLSWNVTAGLTAGNNLIGAVPTTSAWADGTSLSSGSGQTLPWGFNLTSGSSQITTSTDLTQSLFPGNRLVFVVVVGLTPTIQGPFTIVSVSYTSPTCTILLDASLPVGDYSAPPYTAKLLISSVQQQTEQLVTVLGGTHGSDKIGAHTTTQTWADGNTLTPSPSSVQGLLESLLFALGGSSYSGTSKINGALVTNSRIVNSIAAGSVLSQLQNVLGIIANGDFVLTCGDGVTSYGEFNNVSLTISTVSSSGGSILITTLTPHGLSSGASVTVAGVGGATNANGTFFISVSTPTSFTLVGSTPAGSYTGGGTVTCDAITQAVTYWQNSSPMPPACTIYVKAGTYTLTGSLTGALSGLASGQELKYVGDGRSSVLITCHSGVFTNTGAALVTVASGAQISFEAVHIYNLSSSACTLAGSVRGKKCVFEKLPFNFVNVGTPLVTSLPTGMTDVPTAFAIFDDCEFYFPLVGNINFSGQGGGSGFLFRDCVFENGDVGAGHPFFWFTANSDASTWTGLHCERCNFVVSGVNTGTAGVNIVNPSGIMYVNPNGYDLTMTVDDVLFEDCAVSSTDITSDSVVLLHLFPLNWDATSGASRVQLGTVAIRGGVWSLPARGNDFAPFFLQCSRPIIEDLTIVGGGTAATATGPVATSGGGCGNGVYSAAMCETLVGQTSFSMGGGASFLATIAASGAGLASLSTGTTGHGLSVHGLQVQNVNQNSFSGDLCLVGPDKVSGSVDVDGVLVTNITTVASLTHLPYSRIYLRPGASYSTGSIVNQGSTGTFRGISWVATQDMTAPGKSYVQAAYGIVSLGFCGDLDVEAVKVLPGLCVSSGAPGGHEGSNQIAVLAAELWDSTLTLAQRGHLRLYNAYANNLYSSNGVFLLSDFDNIEAGSLQVAMDFGGYAGVSSSSMIGVCISPSYTLDTGTAGFTSQWSLDHCVVQIVNLPSAYTVTGIKSEWPSGGATATHGDVHGCNVILTTTYSSVTAPYNYRLGSLEDVYPNVDFFGNSSIYTTSGGTGSGFIYAFSDGGSPLDPTGTSVINARGFATKISISSGYPMHEEGEAMFYNYGVLTAL